MYRTEQATTKTDGKALLGKHSIKWALAITLLVMIVGAVIMMDSHNEQQVVGGQRHKGQQQISGRDQPNSVRSQKAAAERQ